MAALKAGERFPSFTLMGIDAATYSLTAAGTDPTLLTFFKNTCPTCMLILPYLQRLYERVEGAPLRFWGISQDSAAETRLFGEQYSLTFPLIPDGPGYPVSNACGLTSVPTWFLLEPDATIVRVCVGFSRADLEALAAELRKRFRIPGVAPLFVPADDAPALRPG
ncbi:MAG: TlpA family protein disulfide reductase [Acidobacteria bacterium]|nr:TlpA family protein disulfide reductase [Acidobacteriota bacterium]